MQSWISNVEHGRRNPSWSNVVRLAEGLGVSVSELAARVEAGT
jgi:transcriptional regulator with XRE-family HTH domain